ncbi:MAG: hypothetical protein ACO24A_05945 [Burkholderiaceae bacterium]
MAPIVTKIISILKNVFLFGLIPLFLLVFAFFLGEQFEVGRLGAVASCEDSDNKGTCIRSKGYLPQAPYYPDLGRRYLGGFARALGGDLGASYREALPPPAAAPAESPAPQAAEPAVPLVPPAPPPLPNAKGQAPAAPVTPPAQPKK